jgi:hypothetical protein
MCARIAFSIKVPRANARRPLTHYSKQPLLHLLGALSALTLGDEVNGWPTNHSISLLSALKQLPLLDIILTGTGIKRVTHQC